MEVLTTLSVKEFNSLCRFCTRKQKNLKPIFKEENDGGCFDFTNSSGDNGIVNMLSECTGLEVITNSFGRYHFVAQLFKEYILTVDGFIH